jgi:hypothetical protein
LFWVEVIWSKGLDQMELKLTNNTLIKDQPFDLLKDHSMVFLKTTHGCLFNYKPHYKKEVRNY